MSAISIDNWAFAFATLTTRYSLEEVEKFVLAGKFTENEKKVILLSVETEAYHMNKLPIVRLMTLHSNLIDATPLIKGEDAQLIHKCKIDAIIDEFLRRDRLAKVIE